ncbi:MAG: glycosyltransferase family 4 protein [Mycobacteriales bacterium]
MTSSDLPEPAVLALSTIACSVPPGPGGLGRHFEELIELALASGAPDFQCRYPHSGSPAPAGFDVRPVRAVLGGGGFLRLTPLRWNPGWTAYAANLTFDRGLARSIDRARAGLTAFAGQSLDSFRRARRSGFRALGLVAPNCHVDHVAHQQRIARTQYPVDHGWLNDALRRRTVLEYELADAIFVSSAHQRDTFLAAGVPDNKLVMHRLDAHPRFQRRERPPTGETFQVSYVGRFDLAKGLPVLLDAFFAAAGPQWRLTLQGGFSAHGIKVYMNRRIGGDPRVTLLPAGDPRALLEQSHVFVHPSYDDGFGYGPVEALAVGVPVIVTDQTGMKERLTGGDGYVVPAGDVDALADALRTMARSQGY